METFNAETLLELIQNDNESEIIEYKSILMTLEKYVNIYQLWVMLQLNL